MKKCIKPGKDVFRCCHCLATRPVKWILANHLKRHNKLLRVRRFKCEHCDLRCVSATALRVHARLHTTERPFKCPDCPLAFNISGNLKRHQTTHTDRKPTFKCVKCPACFRMLDNLRTHERYFHTEQRDFKCGVCPAAFKNKYKLARHQDNVHRVEKPFKCVLCPGAYKNLERYRAHLRSVHNTAKPFKCDFCSLSFKWETNCKRHVRTIHSDERPLKCRFCTCNFKDSTSLKSHTISKHVFENKLLCSHCETPFINRLTLAKHIRLVHQLGSSSRFECHHCGLRFAQGSHWFVSLQTPRDVRSASARRLSCPRCSSRLTCRNSALLVRHNKKSGRGRDDRKCSICLFSTNGPVHFLRHMNSHYRMFLYSCHLCPVSYASSKSLSKHVRVVHRRAKPFKCSHCPRMTGFNEKKELLRHILAQHKNRKSG